MKVIVKSSNLIVILAVVAMLIVAKESFLGIVAFLTFIAMIIDYVYARILRHVALTHVGYLLIASFPLVILLNVVNGLGAFSGIAEDVRAASEQLSSLGLVALAVLVVIIVFIGRMLSKLAEVAMKRMMKN